MIEVAKALVEVKKRPTVHFVFSVQEEFNLRGAVTAAQVLMPDVAIQLDLILSYRTNVELYPAFQAYFREHRPPLLAVWGRNDPFFIPSGAEAYKRDNPDAEIHLLDAGHFAIETHHQEIAALMRDFLGRKVR